MDKYTWCDIGSSYLPSDILAAYLLAQLESHDRDPARGATDLERATPRRWRPGPPTAGVRLPVVPDGCEHPAHIFYLLMPSLAARTALLAHLRERPSWPCSTTCRCTSPTWAAASAGATGSAR